MRQRRKISRPRGPSTGTLGKAHWERRAGEVQTGRAESTLGLTTLPERLFTDGASTPLGAGTTACSASALRFGMTWPSSVNRVACGLRQAVAGAGAASCARSFGRRSAAAVI